MNIVLEFENMNVFKIDTKITLQFDFVESMVFLVFFFFLM